MPVTPRARIHTIQDRLAELLGCGPDERTPLVAAMLRRSPTEAVSYWLMLLVSIGIATLGLVLGSSAAVIGAMLVAPLMGPIIGLAMGLATGSPFLVLRSALRVAFSVVLVVAGAAVITLLLPFHEVNAEIAARTAPTALDLLIAAFCALAGVYAALRPGSDTTATAAGTSISISLVPPLCASGYGVGTAAWAMAGGAALLFLTNLVAIVFVGTLSFVAVGFNRTSVAAIEQGEPEHAADAPVSRAVARRLAALFGSRSGPWLRFLMPFVLLAAVYVPLRRALNEVAWEVRVRTTAQQSISSLKQPIVQSRVRVDRHRVDVAIVLLGKSSDADAARAQLEKDIGFVAGVPPHLVVLAVPDAAAFAGLESTLRSPVAEAAETASPAETLDKAREFVRSSVLKYWPVDSAGPTLATEMNVDGTLIVVSVVHQGPELARPALEVLERSVAAEIDRPVRLVASAVPAVPLVRNDDDFRFIGDLSAALRASDGVQRMSICAVRPIDHPSWRPTSARERAFSNAVLALLGARGNVVTTTGSDWKVGFVRGDCQMAADAGVPDAALPDDAKSARD
jgi:uncharacterized hydrophobic protein (TIGR00271 family)